MRSQLFVFIVFILFSTTSFALLPPKYLSVPNWKSCVKTVTEGTAEMICLPYRKPMSCPAASWKQLTRQHLVSSCKK